jgi:hypothetical protein
MRYLALLLLLTAPVLAQQPQQTPLEQALGARLMQELSSGVSCETKVIGLQKQLDDLKKELENAQHK